MNAKTTLAIPPGADFNPFTCADSRSAASLMHTTPPGHTGYTDGTANPRGPWDGMRPLYDQLGGFHGGFTSVTPEAVASATPALVTWQPPTSGAGTVTELATPALLDRGLYLTDTIRQGKRYPRQKNIQGFYYWSTVGHHVWHESELEANVMRRYDLRGDVVAAASQPFTINFADDREHTPDMLLLLEDHRQVVVDVKAATFLPKALEQFEKTKAVCNAAGWEYDIHWDATPQVKVNLDRLSLFKHPGYHPGAEREQRLLSWLGEPRTLREAAVATNPRTVPEGRSVILHLLWTGALTLDLTKPISDRTLIGRTSK
ncbi:TnsA-like heteromeric transposase endonuclease subunit [Leifsonia aquatica]|uniref:TnsA-like heteromeric transposase endonuclease subunit n=1 Tax=Leifsonia aquatica TaxID=144185 RepID=UPI003801B90A